MPHGQCPWTSLPPQDITSDTPIPELWPFSHGHSVRIYPVTSFFSYIVGNYLFPHLPIRQHRLINGSNFNLPLKLRKLGWSMSKDLQIFHDQSQMSDSTLTVSIKEWFSKTHVQDSLGSLHKTSPFPMTLIQLVLSEAQEFAFLTNMHTFWAGLLQTMFWKTLIYHPLIPTYKRVF